MRLGSGQSGVGGGRYGAEGRCLSLSITVGGGIKQVSSTYKLKSKLRVPAKWQANYVSLVIFMCKPRNAAEQNMTI